MNAALFFLLFALAFIRPLKASSLDTVKSDYFSLNCRCKRGCPLWMPEKPRPANYTHKVTPTFKNNTIKIGYLVEFQFPTTLGAVKLAVDDINANKTLLPDVKLEFAFERVYKTTLLEYDAITRMTEMRDNGVVAFIGSSFSCKSEALVASAWNLPLIAFVSLSMTLKLLSIHRVFSVRDSFVYCSNAPIAR